MVALGVAGVVLARSRDRSWPAGLGTALLALALLGPVVWPWYETWGIVLIATAAADTRRWQRGVLAGLSVLGCFADFPSAGVLTGGAPQFVVAAWVALAVCTLGYLALSVRFDGPGGPGADMLARRAGSSDPDQAAAGLPANGAGNQAAGPGTTLR
jgi:hypothetical protein